MGFAGCAARSDTSRRRTELAGLGARILAERDRLLREAETVGLLASRAVQEVG